MLNAVRDGGYDVVLDDLRPIGIGNPVGRRARIKASLTSNNDPDTAFLLLQDAPCDVVIVVDAVRLGVLSADALRAGAAGALALGVVGTSMIAASPAPSTDAVTADAKPADSGSGKLTEAQKLKLQSQLTRAKQQLERQQQKEAQARAILTQAKQARVDARTGAQHGREVLATGMDWDASGQAPEVLVAGQSATNDIEANNETATSAQAAKASKAKKPRAKASKAKASKAKANPNKAKKAKKAKQAKKEKQAKGKVQADRAKAAKVKSTRTKKAQSAETKAAGQASASHLAQHDSGSAAAEVTQEARDAHQQRQKAAAAGHVHRGRELLKASSVKATLSKAARAQARQDITEARQAQKRIEERIRKIDQKLAIRVQPTENYTVTAVFGQPGSYWSLGYHTGVDYAAPAGTPIYAADSGTVVQAGWGGAYGNYTVIEHKNGVTTHYAHQMSQSVSPGQKVSAGQQIGAVGTTGNSTGPHLHFEVRDAAGAFVDPATWVSK